MKFRPAKVENAEQIAQVFKAVYKDKFPYTNPDEVREDLKEDEIFSLVVENKKEIIGFGQLRPPDYSFCNTDKAVEIARMAFKPAYQGQGLGTKLIETLNKELKSRQPNYIFADLQTANCKSQKLLANYDFKPVCLLFGLVPDFIADNTNLTIMISMKLKERIKTSYAVYLPEKYKQLAEFIYDNFSLTREIRTKDRVLEVNNEFKERVEEHLVKSRDMEQEDNYNYHFVSIDITSKAAISKIEYGRRQGLKVEGIIPNLVKAEETKDFLVMRKRPKQTEYDKINVIAGENEKLFQLVE